MPISPTANKLMNGILGIKEDPGKGDPKPNLPQSEDQRFGNWTDQTDTNVMAKSLMDYGLTGADQVMSGVADPHNPDSVRSMQHDWLPAAIQNILGNAYKFHIRTPEALLANKKVLISNPRWQDAIMNDKYFNIIYPNFWDVVANKILPARYKQWDERMKDQTAQK